MLGDNWYGDMGVGYISPRWQQQFEQMYPTSHFPGPAYVVLGNHDYERQGVEQGRPATRLRSARQGHALDAALALVQLPVSAEGSGHHLHLPRHQPARDEAWRRQHFQPWSFDMKKEDRDQQDAWFRAELAKPRTTPFVACVAHHPLYTNGVHGTRRSSSTTGTRCCASTRWTSGSQRPRPRPAAPGVRRTSDELRHLRRRRRRARRLDDTARAARPVRRQGHRASAIWSSPKTPSLPPRRRAGPGAPHLPQDTRRQGRDLPSGLIRPPRSRVVIHLGDAVAVPRAHPTSRSPNPHEPADSG